MIISIVMTRRDSRTVTEGGLEEGAGVEAPPNIFLTHIKLKSSRESCTLMFKELLISC